MGLMEAVMQGPFMTKEREKAIKEGLQEGLQQGIKQGIKQGIEQGIRQGLEKGHDQGLQSGQSAEARKLLRTVLKTKFPGLETMPEIDQILSTDSLEALFEAALVSNDRVQVEQNIRGGC